MKYSIEDVKTKQIGIQYLQGKLDEDLSKAFEEFLMEHPEELDDLSLDNVFNETPQEAYTLSKNNSSSGIFNSLWRYLTAGAVGAFATFLIVSFTMTSKPPVTMSSSASITFIETTRGVDTGNIEVTLDENNKASFFIQSSILKKQQYTIKLVDTSNGDLLIEDRISSNAAGEIVVVLNLTHAKSNLVRMTIKDLENNTATNYILELNR